MGREEIRAPLKMPAWEVRRNWVELIVAKNSGTVTRERKTIGQ